MNEFVKFYAKNNLLTRSKMKALEKYSTLSGTALLELYNEAFIDFFNKAYHHSAFYGKLYRNAGLRMNDIKDLNDIQKLPVINRLHIRDHAHSIYQAPSFLKTRGLTSGTTGTPLEIFRTIFDVSYEQAYIRYYRNLHGYSIGQPLLSIRGTLGKNTPYEFYKKANILYISSPNINASNIDMYYDMITKFKPVAVEAYPSYLQKLCTELNRKNLNLHIPNAFTSSEMLMEFQRAYIEPFLNTQIHDWYGNAERTILLAQDENFNYKPLPLYSINEYEDDKVITTGLINNRFPLIRYEVNDTVHIKPKSFLEDLINPDIQRIEGRAGDHIDLKDGSIVGCIDHAFKGVKNLETAQVHQYDVNEPIQVKLVVREGFSQFDEDQLRSNFVRMVGRDTELLFVYCQIQDLHYGKNEKFRLIIKNRPHQTK